MTVESLRAVEFPLIGRYVGRAVSRHRRRVETAAKHKTSIHYVCVCVYVCSALLFINLAVALLLRGGGSEESYATAAEAE